MSPRVRAAIVSMGSELLLGDLIDTNASWLAKRLSELGIQVVSGVTVPDQLDEMDAALRWACSRAEVVIVGGGLGPTQDDLTREAVAAVAGVELEARPDLEEALIEGFAARGWQMPASNLRQARIPAGASIIVPVGTAPGFALDVGIQAGSARVFALPGVPWELKQMFDEQVVPELVELTGGGATVTRTINVAGMQEAAVADALAELSREIDAVEGSDLAYLARKDGIEVRLTATGADSKDAHAMTEPYVQRALVALGPAVSGIDDETLEQAVVRLLTERGQTVATAESVTAGGIAARLARVPGASNVLAGGVVVYTPEAKQALAGVSAADLEAHGPVSEVVTSQLAVGVREHLGTDWGIGATGAAGPTPHGGVEVGTVIWALVGTDISEVHMIQLPGTRELVQSRLVTAALETLRRRLLEG